MSASHASAPRQTLSSIETGRGVAAILVVLYHASVHMKKETGEMPFSSAFLFGHAGVDFFFVISGFIICYVHHAHIGQPSRLPRYLMRRISRIYPLFWVALLFSALLILLKGEVLPTSQALSIDALLLPGESLVGVSWTLRFEMMFYALFALLFLVGQRTGFILWAVWSSAIIAFLLFGNGKAPIILDSYNLQFLMGTAVAYIALKHAFSKQASVITLLLGIGLFMGVGVLENTGVLDGYGSNARIYYGLPAALIILGSAQLDRNHAIKPVKVGVFLGSLSYSIYLMHLFGIGFGNQFIGVLGLNSFLNSESKLLLLSASGLIFGIIVGLCIERPLQKCFKPRPAKGHSNAPTTV